MIYVKIFLYLENIIAFESSSIFTLTIFGSNNSSCLIGQANVLMPLCDFEDEIIFSKCFFKKWFVTLNINNKVLTI